MGGFETRLITLRRPEVFNYYGLLSGGVYAPGDIKDKNQVASIFISCGSKENPAGVTKAVEDLKAARLQCNPLLFLPTQHMSFSLGAEACITWHSYYSSKSMYAMKELNAL